MKRLTGILLLCQLALPVAGQGMPGGHSQRVQARWNVDFLYYFDNGEFDAGDLVRSGTIHAAVLTPTLSLQTGSRRVSHTLTLGADLQHDMGSQTWCDLPREGLLYYDGRVRTPRGVFEGVAGIYPRSLMQGF